MKLALWLIVAALLAGAGWKVNGWRTAAAERWEAVQALASAQAAWSAQHQRDVKTARADAKASGDLANELVHLHGQVTDLRARVAAAQLIRPDFTPTPGAPAHGTSCNAAVGLSADFRLLYNSAYGLHPAIPENPPR